MATIRYREGFPTKITAPRLDRMLRELGPPAEIKRTPGLRHVIRIEWPPIFPGVPIPSYELSEPWPDQKGKIEITAITED